MCVKERKCLRVHRNCIVKVPADGCLLNDCINTGFSEMPCLPDFDCRGILTCFASQHVIEDQLSPAAHSDSFKYSLVSTSIDAPVGLNFIILKLELTLLLIE